MKCFTNSLILIAILTFTLPVFSDARSSMADTFKSQQASAETMKEPDIVIEGEPDISELPNWGLKPFGKNEEGPQGDCVLTEIKNGENVAQKHIFLRVNTATNNMHYFGALLMEEANSDEISLILTDSELPYITQPEKIASVLLEEDFKGKLQLNVGEVGTGTARSIRCTIK